MLREPAQEFHVFTLRKGFDFRLEFFECSHKRGLFGLRLELSGIGRARSMCAQATCWISSRLEHSGPAFPDAARMQLQGLSPMPGGPVRSYPTVGRSCCEFLGLNTGRSNPNSAHHPSDIPSPASQRSSSPS
jgi:hypothetical protein